MAARTIRDGTIVVKDGASLTATATCDGEMSWKESHPVIEITDRGLVDHLRPGTETGMDISFNLKVQDIYDATSATVYNILTKTGAASSATSTNDASDVYTVDIELTLADPAGGSAEILTFEDCAITSIDFSEAEDGDRLVFTLKSMNTQPSFS